MQKFPAVTKKMTKKL